MKRWVFVSLAASLVIGSLTLAFLVSSNASPLSPTATETAVLAGTIANGGTIPLPVFADGTPALESQCKWTVGLGSVATDLAMTVIQISTTGRVVHINYSCQYFCGGGTANYLIIATRPAPGSAASIDGGRIEPSSWGRVKTKLSR